MNTDKITALHAIRDRFKGNSAAAQRMRLLAAMSEHSGISTYEASRGLDIYHSPARVKELRQRGENIATYWQKVPTECGTVHRVGVYVLHNKGGAKA